MRENRLSGSEGGATHTVVPTPILHLVPPGQPVAFPQISCGFPLDLEGASSQASLLLI